MNKLMLKTLLEIFATLVSIKGTSYRQLSIIYIEIYFSRFLTLKDTKQKKEEYIDLLNQIKESPSIIDMASIYKTINTELSKSQRILFLINLIEFIGFIEKNELTSNSEINPLNDLVEQISENIKVSKTVYNNCKNFVTDNYNRITDQERILFARDIDPKLSKSKFISIKNLKGFMAFYFISDAQITLFKYNGSSILELNSRLIFPKNIYIFQSGSRITSQKNQLISYSQIVKYFKGSDFGSKLTLTADNVNFSYSKSAFGVKNVNFTGTSGELIGIIGGSGSGKTTLLNILNGNIKYTDGAISINGVSYSNNINKLQQYIGYVPQDDSLIEELTVFENLYFTTVLSRDNIEKTEIKSIVENYLEEFSLYNIRNNKIGLSTQRLISGGQRKRINIVSELIREPNILLVDEPTSGLSSSDSYKIVLLLKEQASKGKLVIVNIHQPSSEIFRLFDKIIVLDNNGYMIFFGNPVESIEYFVGKSEKIDKTAIECNICNTLKPDQLFEIIEENVVDENGEITNLRKRTPEEWSNLYQQTRNYNQVSVIEDLPPIKASRPSKSKQLRTFLQRFALSKIRDREFIIYAVAIPILLALILSFFSRYSVISDMGVHEYSYYENDNMPIFFLMSILACLFSGLIITADCLIRDKALLKREKFFFLNKVSYLNSKIIFYAGISVLQTLVFTVVSVLILEIPGSFIKFWVLLLIVNLLGNITGIIISTLIKSAAAAYLIIPFLIIPQIIFSGIAIPFHQLNFILSNEERVPLIGNITLSRWGIEAILVDQFKNNQYEKHFFDIDRKESQVRYKAYFLIPELINTLNSLSAQDINTGSPKYQLINNELNQLGINSNVIQKENYADSKYKNRVIGILENKKDSLSTVHSGLLRNKNNKLTELSKKLGSSKDLLQLRNTCTNNGIEKFVLNRKSSNIHSKTNSAIVQMVDPVFIEPKSGLFRNQLFTAEKKLFGFAYGTYSVNVIFLTIVFIFHYLFLLLAFRIKKY